VRRDVFRGEAVIVVLIHTDAYKIDKENKILGLLSVFNQELLGFRDNTVFACQYSRSSIIAKRTVIIIPLLAWVYYRSKRGGAENTNTQSKSAAQIYSHS